MASYQPRRAKRPTKAVRIARITVPALLAGTLAAGVAVAAWPQQESLSAVPITGASADATPAVDRTAAGRTSRDQVRPTPTPTQLPADSPFAANRVRKADSGTTPAAKSAQSKAPATTKTKVQAKSKAPSAGSAGTQQRTEAAKAEPKLDLTVIGSRYLTEDLNLRTEPDKDAKVVSVLETRSKVKVTDTVEDGFRLIVREGKARWVTDEYLAKKQPPKESAISEESCNKDSSIESGLVSNGIKVYRALCAKFPNITSFGGRRSANGGFHPTGQAVDAMISNGGWEVARWLRANASRLGVSEVIHAQSIWTVQRSGEGWRGMSDQGNATANHFDHVHISVY